MSLRRRLAHISAFPLAIPVARYIITQRDRLAKEAVRLAPALANQFEPYYSPELLGDTRVVASATLPLPKFPFESTLRRIRMCIPAAQFASAITFDNVVVVRDVASSRLIFHELVHVAQYRLLGTARFARLYVRGFLLHGIYDRIPLECCASVLEERFATDPKPFSVEAAVRSWIKQDLL